MRQFVKLAIFMVVMSLPLAGIGCGGKSSSTNPPENPPKGKLYIKSKDLTK